MLASVVDSAEDVFGLARVRRVASGTPPDVFRVDERVRLEYVGESDAASVHAVHWSMASFSTSSAAIAAASSSSSSSSSTCELSSTTSSSTNLTCSSAAVVRVRVTRELAAANRTDTFYTTISPSAGCYSWQAVVVDTTVDASLSSPALSTLPSGRSDDDSGLELRVWAMDANVASLAERQGLLGGPSALSAQLSLSLHNVGELPTMTAVGVQSPNVLINTPLTFSTTTRMWTATVRTNNPDDTNFNIVAKGAIVLGCSVAPRLLSLSVSIMPPAFIIDTDASSTLPAGNLPVSRSVLAIAPCIRSIGVALLNQSHQVVMSQNGFAATSVVNINITGSTSSGTCAAGSHSYPLSSGFVVRDVVLTRGGLVALTDLGAVVITPGVPTFRLSCSLPLHGFDIVSGATACDYLREFENTTSPLNQVVVAFSSTNVSAGAYLSTDGGVTFAPLPAPPSASLGLSQSESTAWPRITAVQPLFSGHDRLGFVMHRSGDTSSALMVYDASSSTWSLRNEFDSIISQAVQVASASAELLFLSEAGDLLYSPDEGTTMHGIALVSRDTRVAPHGLASGDAPVQIAVDEQGRFAVLARSGRLFIGVAGLPEALEVQSGLLPNTTAMLYFHSNSLWALELHDSSDTGITSRFAIPHVDDLVSPRAPVSSNRLLQCSYLATEGTQFEELGYLDMNEELVYEVTLFAEPGSPATVSFSTSDPSLLAFETQAWSTFVSSTSVSEQGQTSTDEDAPATLDGSTLVKVTRRAVVTESPGTYANRTVRLQQAEGSGSVRAIPSPSTLVCPEPIPRASRVRVGCPPNRHIRVRASSSDCDPDWRESSFASVAEASEYSKSVYGCKRSVFHQTDGFLPQIDLYDGDTYVKPMLGNWVVWEVQGRSDFTYNATAGDVRCLNRPLTWSEVKRTRASLSKDEQWTPEIYRDCFESSASPVPFSSGLTYEILNGSGTNFLRFDKTGNDGLFLFKVRVIDDSYSFCELSTHFAVDAFGAPLGLETSLLIVGIATAVLLLALAASYWHYRAKMSLKVKQE